MMKKFEDRINTHLKLIYGDTASPDLTHRIMALVDDFRVRHPGLSTADGERVTAEDAVLITYGDSFLAEGQMPLQTLGEFLNTYLNGIINGVHILPFYPYTSDDGFSVVDYLQVDPALGTWDDIRQIGANFRMMYDAVINHISQSSRWFQGYLRGESPYTDYFISIDPETDLSYVVRPRALPLLTRFETARGERHVWTTFSTDQIDLNYENPEVLLEIINVLLEYVSRGAEIIRLDAIAYLWKTLNTPCIHLPQTHEVVKLWRTVLDAAAPATILITETNVPHEENLSYFGNGQDEAQLVYQFPLAPLVLHTFQTGDAGVLTRWAASLENFAPNATFFNFIASHDGIGMRPAEGLLTPAEIQTLVDQVITHGGQVSYKNNPDGSRSVYELNITLYDMLNDPGAPDIQVDVPRFLASQAIILSLQGVPGIYIHSLFGSRNCQACVAETGRARSINREKLAWGPLQTALTDPATRQAQVFIGYTHMLKHRRAYPAFHPMGGQQVLNLDPSIFAVLRTPPSGSSPVLCLTSVTSTPTGFSISHANLNLPAVQHWQDILSGETFTPSRGTLTIPFTPYQTRWLKPA